MPKRSRKTPDENVTAFEIMKAATEESAEKPRKKNPAAVALGRLGGKKGGPARKKALSAKRRKEIAQKAANSRWGKSNRT